MVKIVLHSNDFSESACSATSISHHLLKETGTEH